MTGPFRTARAEDDKEIKKAKRRSPSENRPEAETKTVIPLRDFEICQNGFYLKLVKGESLEVPRKFLPNLTTEKVI